MTIATTPLQGSVRGIPLAMHPAGDFVSDEIRRTGDFHEAEILDAIATIIEPGLLVDAGAMIGNHSAYLAAFVPHTAIHAFEPWPANVELLRRNVASYPSVTVHPVALSDHAWHLRMASEPNLGHSRVTENGPLEVEAVTLDSFGFEDVTFLKIDVESHEPQLLAGAAETIERCHPLILIEDWTGKYGDLLPGYRQVAEWGRARQTYLYLWAP